MNEPLARSATIEQRLGRVTLHRHTVVAAGRSWQIDAVRDQDQLLAAADHFDAFPYGLLLWDASVVLADTLAEMGPLEGLSVLELGAGVGLSGLAARQLGGDVVQTDHAGEALALAQYNARLNGIDGVRQALADWEHWEMTDRFNLIIGSDILYDGSAHGPIANVLSASLADGGMAVLTDPGRTATPFFLRDMRAAGWRVDERVRTSSTIHPVRAGETVDIKILTIRK